MTMPPAVSIIMPTYDRLEYLKEAVASVRAQTVTNWELVVVDDGSTDASVAWLEGIGDPRIAVMREEHTGNRSIARNRGVARSSATWLAFIDSDDLWLPNKLEVQLEQLATRARCRWSCTGVTFINASGAPIPQRAGTTYFAQSGWVLEQLLQFSASATMPSLVVHRSLFEEGGGFDESLVFQEDYEFELRMAALSELHATEESLTIVRHHDGRTSSNERASALHHGTELVYRKVARTTSSQRVRNICSRQIALQLVSRARALSREGARFAAVRSAARAVLEQPSMRETWRAAVGATLRMFNLRAEAG